MWVAVGCALALGALVRAGFTFSTDFPLNDGGMFYAMAGDLRGNGYRLPEYSSYNFDSIPFAYPPLPFYAAALLADAGLPLLDVFRLLPLALSLGTLGAFVLLARRMLDDRVALAASVFAFAMIPRSYEWLLMGGGVTRSFGLLFALLALHEAARMYEARRPSTILTTGALAGLVALSHLEMTWFFVFSCALLWFSHGRTARTALMTAGAAAVGLAVAAPAVLTTLTVHGIDPFIAALTTGSPSATNPVLAFLVFRATDEPMFPVIAASALMGVAWCISRREWLLPVWVLACGILDPRGFGNVACVPLALLAGLAVAHVLLPTLQGSKGAGWRVALPVLALAGAYAIVNAMVATPGLLTSLPADERAAMEWVREETPPGAEFLVVTHQSWAVDRTSEWFPVLAERRSVGTVQGTEWVREAFQNQLSAHRDLQECAEFGGGCLNAWDERYGITYDYLFIPKTAHLERGAPLDPDECCAALRNDLRRDARYEVVFDGEGATVFRRLR